MSVVIRATAVLAMMLAGLAVSSPVHAGPFDDNAPDTRDQVTSTSPLNTGIRETVDTADDQDWFRFTTTAPGYARVLLTHMAANLRLRVYRADGTLLTGSARQGWVFEEVYRHLPAGTYYVQVSSQDGSASTVQRYQLVFRPLTEGVKVLSSRVRFVPSKCGYYPPEASFVEGELLNNTASSQERLQVTVRLYDWSNNVLATRTIGILEGGLAGARRRVHFKTRFEISSDSIGRHVVSVTASPTSRRPLAGVGGTVDSVTKDCSDGIVRGRITNRSGGPLSRGGIAHVDYGGDGGVDRITHVAIGQLAAGADAPYLFRADYVSQTGVQVYPWGVR